MHTLATCPCWQQVGSSALMCLACSTRCSGADACAVQQVPVSVLRGHGRSISLANSSTHSVWHLIPTWCHAQLNPAQNLAVVPYPLHHCPYTSCACPSLGCIMAQCCESSFAFHLLMPGSMLQAMHGALLRKQPSADSVAA